MPFGVLDTSYIDFPAGVDIAYLQGLRTRAGVQFPQLLREIDSRLAALNGSVDPLVAQLVTLTTEQWSDTTGPANFVVEEASEYTVARPQMIEGQATMLPLRKYDVSLGFTEEGLETMSLARILTNVDGMVGGFKRLYLLETLRRLFSDAEVRVDVKTTTTSPGFAGSGTGTNVFSRSYPDGTALPTGYTHYYRDTVANRAVAIKAARDRLKKWYTGPFDLIASQAEIDAIAADTANFVSAGSTLVRPAQGTAEALVDPSLYIGVYDKNIRVQIARNEFSTSHIAIFKSFGNYAAMNPLAWRYDEMFGRNAYVRSRQMFPLDQAVMLQRFGVGVNNRVAAVLIYLAASGAYTPPAIA